MSQPTEKERIRQEYQRRALEVDPALYAPWNAAEELLRASRRRLAAAMLHREGCFPRAGQPILEVGCGRLGWLAEMLSWGCQERDLHGIDLDEDRIAQAHQALPAADLRLGDATELPWPENTFQLVVVSTVFTSILDDGVRRKAASEIQRVLAPGGALLWYDFRYDNPKNSQVRKVGKRELRRLFPGLRGKVRSTSLAPPLARLVAPRCYWLAAALEALPPLRSHLVAVLVKS